MTDAASLALLAIDPVGLGGIRLHGGPGPGRDAVVNAITAMLGGPRVRVPAHITDDRLYGGLSLADTLRTGRPVLERGVLARAHGGALVIAMAERASGALVAALSAALDRGEVRLERQGLARVEPCRAAVIALDEGVGEDEQIADALRDRLAFDLDVDRLDARVLASIGSAALNIDWAAARARRASVRLEDEGLAQLCATAELFGVGSLRAPLLAARAAIASAALDGRAVVAPDDLAAAARLVFGPRATRVPTEAPSEPAPAEPSEAEPNEGPQPRGAGVDELLVAAARSALPPGLLEGAIVSAARRAGVAGRAGARRTSGQAGRPAGSRPGALRHGDRLDVVATLRAAAPWQRLRGATDRVIVCKEDFRVRRTVSRTETTVIFAVDASGSSALQRLAEAKGAALRVLADCYVRRDQVALVGFRGHEASTLLPPTRSLTRARRELAGLVGGGGTPLAAGIAAAHRLAREARDRGRTPLVVLMTDGRANVALDGGEGAEAATRDATDAARALREDRIASIFLDTAPRPRRRARTLADAMAARYLPLPHLDAAGVSREVRALG